MGRKLTPDEEHQALKAIIREGHEVIQALHAAIREARVLEPGLVARFEELHLREMQQLSDHMNAEHNRISAELNTAVGEARQEILHQLTPVELDLDKDGRTAR